MNAVDTRNSIAQILKMNRRGVDVQIVLDKTPSGIWLWDERSQTHCYFSSYEEISSILGDCNAMQGYCKNLPVFHTSWRFMNPKRLEKLAQVGS